MAQTGSCRIESESPLHKRKTPSCFGNTITAFSAWQTSPIKNILIYSARVHDFCDLLSGSVRASSCFMYSGFAFRSHPSSGNNLISGHTLIHFTWVQDKITVLAVIAAIVRCSWDKVRSPLNQRYKIRIYGFI